MYELAGILQDDEAIAMLAVVVDIDIMLDIEWAYLAHI